MSFTMIGAEDLAGKGVVGLPDAPGLSAAEMQRRMDEIAKEVIVPAFNRLIGELGAEGAAALIGAKDGEETSTVQAVVEKLTDALAEKVAAEMLKTADGAGMVGAKDGEGTSDVQTLLDALKKSITDQTAEALTAAKKYTDDKAFAAGSADMSKSVYDPNGVEEDVFAYVENAVSLYADTVVSNLRKEITGELDKKANGEELGHAKSGTVHALTGLAGTGIILATFVAAADYAEGDTFTVNGTAYTAKMQNGEALSDGFFAAGALVSCVLDTEGRTVNFKGGGGLSDSDLATATATEADVTAGKTFFAGGKELRTGTGSSCKLAQMSYTSFSAGQSITMEVPGKLVFGCAYGFTSSIATNMTGSSYRAAVTVGADAVMKAASSTNTATLSYSGGKLTLTCELQSLNNGQMFAVYEEE